MADTKISALPNYTTPIDIDVVPIVDETAVQTKHVTWANIKVTLKAYFDPLYLSTTTGVTLSQSTPQTIGTTTNRVLKLWATDITVSNAIAGSITGNAATVTTNANLTGDVTSVGNAATVVKINGTSLATLSTGILKNTTGTGVPSIAVAADFPTLNQNTTGTAAGLSTTLVIGSGGTGKTSVTITPTATAWAGWDANKNLSAANFLEGYATTATAAGTTTLTVASNNTQYFTGSTTQTVVLPVTSTLVLGQSYWIVNLSTGAVTVNSSGGNAIVVVAAGTQVEVTCILTSGTTAASWNAMYNVRTPQNAQTGTAYTLVATDAGKEVSANNASANTVTVPNSVFTAGDKVIVTMLGAGVTTIVAGSGVTLTDAGGGLVLNVNGRQRVLYFETASNADVI